MAGGVTLTATIQGLDGVLNRFKQARGTVSTEITRSLNQATAQGRRTIQAGTPVRTGNARRGVQSRSTGPMSREIYNDVSYFIFLVLGTRYMGANAMLNAAIAKAAKDMDKTLGDTGTRIAATLTRG